MVRKSMGLSVVVAGCALIFSGGLASAGEAPLAPVPAEYADKHMPAGGWTDAKAIEAGKAIYEGKAVNDVDCSACHGNDGKPKKKGARDLRDPKNASRYSDSYWFWRVSEGIPKTKMKANKAKLTEEQIWQVIAYQHMFSHDGKPSEHTDYKP